MTPELIQMFKKYTNDHEKLINDMSILINKANRYILTNPNKLSSIVQKLETKSEKWL